MPRHIIVVQGAQWGSEAKGMVAAELCRRRKIDISVRTGAVNAGHTVYDAGKKYVNQQLPVGWVNRTSTLVIGAGALVHPEILLEEIKMVKEAGFNGDILIDHRAGLHLPAHTETSQLSGSHYRIGATGKGCSHALIDRISRKPGVQLFKEYWEQLPTTDTDFGNEPKWQWADTAKFLNDAYDDDRGILLEGTQGTLLDLYFGPYPYTTHKQCTAGQWAIECGLSPNLLYEIVLVARTYPIRVAGNSGPMPGEMTWVELAREINNKREMSGLEYIVDPAAVNAFEEKWESMESQYSDPLVEKSCRNADAMARLDEPTVAELKKLFEFTTVTKKLRRVGRMDLESLQYSMMLNRPDWVALTFVNYEFPDMWGITELPRTLPLGFNSWVSLLNSQLGHRIGALSFGPEGKHFMGKQAFTLP